MRCGCRATEPSGAEPTQHDKRLRLRNPRGFITQWTHIQSRLQETQDQSHFQLIVVHTLAGLDKSSATRFKRVPIPQRHAVGVRLVQRLQADRLASERQGLQLLAKLVTGDAEVLVSVQATLELDEQALT